jgi:hypothetical protein
MAFVVFHVVMECSTGTPKDDHYKRQIFYLKIPSHPVLALAYNYNRLDLISMALKSEVDCIFIIYLRLMNPPSV